MVYTSRRIHHARCSTTPLAGEFPTFVRLRRTTPQLSVPRIGCTTPVHRVHVYGQVIDYHGLFRVSAQIHIGRIGANIA